jgi:hypothetical protein
MSLFSITQATLPNHGEHGNHMIKAAVGFAGLND